MAIARLEREVYAISMAARLLDMPRTTLKYWLEGDRRGEKTHLPILRESATGSRNVTWGEFIEAGLLRQYRLRSVPMVELRAFISHLRGELGVPYPLAHAHPYTSGRDLLWEAQEVAGLGEDSPFVSLSRGGQYLLLSPADAFVNSVQFDDSATAALWRPLPQAHDVILDPEQRFGAPTIGGIRTATLLESSEDVGIEETASLYDLTTGQVHQAVAYEQIRLAQAS